MTDTAPANRPASLFPVTRWSVVADAGDPGEPESAAALEELCRSYWIPLYAESGAHSLSPEQLFDKRWALALIETALARIESEYRESGRNAEFLLLRPCLTASRGEIDYAALARDLDRSEGAARVAVHRIRKRYRSLFREEIARTVRDESLVEEELRALMQALER